MSAWGRVKSMWQRQTQCEPGDVGSVLDEADRLGIVDEDDIAERGDDRRGWTG